MALAAVAGTALLALQGCGMLSSGGNRSTTTAATGEQAAATEAAELAAASNAGGGVGGPGTGTSTSTSTGKGAGPSMLSAAPMNASAGTGAWINPQSRQEPGDDNAPSTFNLQQITFAEEGADFDPAISRDGGRIVFASTQHRPTADLYVKTVAGRTITQLTNDPAEDGTPDISPDGTKVAFASNRDGNWDIFVIPITGGKAVQITSDGSDELHPSWSADGTKLVFSRMGPTSGRWEMWVTEAGKAGNATFIGYGLFPRWCPASGTGADGSDRIVFQLGRERGQRSFAIWTIDYAEGQSSNPTLIASSASSALINPTWSPDGNYVVYASVPNAESGGGPAGGPPAAELWLASVTADATVRLTSSDLRAIRPAWGPSNRLYFVSDRNSSENIWSIDLAQSLASIGGTPAERGMTTAGIAGRVIPGKVTLTKSAPSPKPERAAKGAPVKESEDEKTAGTTADAGGDQ